MQTSVEHDRDKPGTPTPGWQFLGAISGVRAGPDSLEIACGHAVVRISAERAGILRVRLAPQGLFRRDFSWAVTPAESRGDAGPASRMKSAPAGPTGNGDGTKD